MHKYLYKYIVLCLALVSAFTAAIIVPASAAQFSPAIFTIDQDVVDGKVIVTRATSNGIGWVVIHADDGGAPGPVIGQTAIPAGISAAVVVDVDVSGMTDTLHAMLHVDEGEVGKYEFPGPDVPVQLNNQVVMQPFAVTSVGNSIVGLAANSEGFSTLIQAIEAAGLTETLRQDGPFTVFAPTDDAFAAIPQADLDKLLADPEALTAVLTYHVIPAAVRAAEITDGMETETVQGATLKFTMSDGKVMVNDSAVLQADLEAYNGVIHVIDKVLAPPPAEESAVAAAAAPEAATPGVTASNQESDGKTVTVDAVTTSQSSWVVIHADDGGKPGVVLGQTRVSAGNIENVIVGLSEPISGETTLWAMLHVDEGRAGVYEFPGADGPVVVDGQVVMLSFAATAPAGEAPAAEASAAMTETQAITETATATEPAAPAVKTEDQESDGASVLVDEVVATQPGWIVIHVDDAGKPGPVIGQTAVDAGASEYVPVNFTQAIAGETTLWAMLHVDEGQAGVYEFPGADVPVVLEGQVVMAPFVVMAPAAEASSTIAETAAMTETQTMSETVAEAAPAEAAPTEKPAEPAPAAPETLPTTGGSLATSITTLPVVLAILLVLLSSAVLSRRRPV